MKIPAVNERKTREALRVPTAVTPAHLTKTTAVPALPVTAAASLMTMMRMARTMIPPWIMGVVEVIIMDKKGNFLYHHRDDREV